MTLSCFERSLMLADDSNMADVWYNIGQVDAELRTVHLAPKHHPLFRSRILLMLRRMLSYVDSQFCVFACVRLYFFLL